MAKITKITVQKRSAERFSVFLDGAYRFSVDGLSLSNLGLRVGQEVTEDDISRFQNQAENDRAYEVALRRLSYRRRSSSEVKTYLIRHEYSEATTKAVVERLSSLGLIDDEAFARAWVADRRLLRPRSKRALAAELASKGIDRVIITTTLDQSDAGSELAALITLVERKRRLSQYHDPQKLIGYLARQGYDYAVIKEALARFD